MHIFILFMGLLQMAIIGGERDESSSTMIGGLKRSRLNQSEAMKVQQPQRAKHVTAQNRKTMGSGLSKQPWVKTLINLAVKWRESLRGKAHRQKAEFASWDDNDSLLLKVCASAKQIEGAIVMGNEAGAYALAGQGFIRHREEAINALLGDSHTASAPSL